MNTFAKKIAYVSLISGLASLGFGQSWTSVYGQALDALKAKDYVGARKLFQQSIAYRPEDISAATYLPGPVSSRKVWRDGAPYSPNFGAAYSLYKDAIATTDAKSQADKFALTETELRTLLEKGQLSRQTYFILSDVYAREGKLDKQKAMTGRYGDKMDWKVDTAGLAQEDLDAIAAAYAVKLPVTNTTPKVEAPQTKPTTTPPVTTPPVTAPVVEKKDDQQPTMPVTAGGQRRKPKGNDNDPKKPATEVDIIPAESLSSLGTGPKVSGPVPVNANKFALVIGNAQNKSADYSLAFALEDADRVKSSLVDSAGYAPDHIEMLANPTAKQVMDTAAQLSGRIPDGGTVFIYYAGAGANIGSKDYLVASDSDAATATTMVSKFELYRLFMARGARIFAFFEANRPIVDGRYFGMEVPQVGSISQSQATLPGGTVTSKVRNGKEVGIYADALTLVFGDLHSNRIPISEFGWQVFYKIRRGDTGTTGGGSKQTPTLPVLSNLAADSRF